MQFHKKRSSFSALLYLFLTGSAIAQQVVYNVIQDQNIAALVTAGREGRPGQIDPTAFGVNTYGQSLATGSGALAIGASEQSNFEYSPSVTSYTNVSSLTYATGAVAIGDRSVAIGSNQGGETALLQNTGFPTSPYVCGGFGDYGYSRWCGETIVRYGAIGQDSIAIGTRAFAEKDSSTAIGKDSQVNISDGVAIGSHSIAGTPHTGDYTINGGSIAGTTATGTTFSVGAPDFERQVQNVAAGVVSATSTDAVNGSQLYAVGSKVKQNTDDIVKNNTAIAALDTTVAAQGVAIGKNTIDIAKNTADINSLDTTVAAQGVTIGQHTTEINKNTADIAALDTTLTAQGVAIGQNTTNIAKNTADIASLDTTVTVQGVAIAQNTTKIAKNTADLNTLGTTTAAALGGGASYSSDNGISAPNYAIQGRTYNDVGSALSAVDNNLTNIQGQVNTLSAGYIGHTQEITGLKQSVQRGYEGTAVALATAGGNFLQESQKFSVTGKFGSFRGQYGMGAVAQARLNQNVVAHAGVGGGVRYGGVGAFGGLTVGW